jgi:O-antigen/teichoic acid export membrane protein
MSLVRRFASGALWAVAGNAANNIISFVVFAIVAQIVEPAVLGVAALAIVLVELGKLVAIAGTAHLLVQRQTWDENYSSLAFWLNLSLGAALTLLAMFVVAPLMEEHFATGSGAVVGIVSVCLLVDAARAAHESKLRREFSYNKLAARGAAAGVISGLIGVGLVWLGFGIWGLVAQRVASSVLTTIFSWLASGWVPRLVSSAHELPSMLINGYRLMAAELLVNINLRVPELVLASSLGPAAVAVYRVGARGFDALHQLIVVPLMTASVGGFSRIQDKQTTGRAYVRTTRFVALVAYPSFFGAAAIAEPFVRLAFGPHWSVSAHIMSIICIGAAPAILGYMAFAALTALGHSRQVFWVNVASVISSLAVAAMAARFGLLVIALGLAIRAYVAGAANMLILRRVVGVDLVELARALLPPFVSAAVMSITVLVLERNALSGFATWFRLLVSVAVGGVLYPALLWLLWTRYLGHALDEVRAMFPGLIKPLAFLPTRGVQDG